MPPAVPPFPASAAARDRWIVARRSGIPRDPGLDPWKAAGWCVERETSASGVEESGLTAFVTNRECPWRCLMCDLWRHTLPESVPPGAIPAQMRGAIAAAGGAAGLRWIKLYNAGSFFDRAAIPVGDHEAIADACRSFDRVVVECHPALVGPRVATFRARLRPGTRLEVAMGLETVHPGVLDRLNKRVTTEGFARAARWLRDHGCDIRAFVLAKPPFMDEAAALEWGCRSVDFAFGCGVDPVVVIPTRPGNGALDALEAAGDFSPPRLATLEAVVAHGLAARRGRVFADLWDLGRFATDAAELSAARERLERMNRTQRAVAA